MTNLSKLEEVTLRLLTLVGYDNDSIFDLGPEEIKYFINKAKLFIEILETEEKENEL